MSALVSPLGAISDPAGVSSVPSTTSAQTASSVSPITPVSGGGTGLNGGGGVGGGAQSPHSKKKRNRITLSCTECHRRKQQCDRGNPCSRCVKRGMADSCVMETRDAAPVPSGGLRGRKKSKPGGLGRSDGPYPNPGAQPNGSSTSAASPATNGTNGHGHHAPPPPMIPITMGAGGSTSYLGPGTVADFLNKIGFPQAANDGQHVGSVYAPLPKPGEVDHATRPDMRPQFPPRHVTDYLVSYFFGNSTLNWLYDSVHRPTFDRTYVQFWVRNEPENLDFVALLAVMCASALQFLLDSDMDRYMVDVPPELGPDRESLRAKLFNFSRMTLATSEHEQNPTLERLQTMLLVAIYSKNEGSATDNYSIIGAAIRIAQSMGMHRDGESKWGMRPLEAELRRRMWWNLYSYDRCQNMTLGRPYVIHDQHCDVRIPLNIDEDELVDADKLVGKSREVPTHYSYQILNIHYSQIVGRIADQCFGVRPPTYRTVLELDSALHDFERNLPSFFRTQSAADAVERPYLAYQSQMMMMNLQSTRIALHRPFLLRNPPDEDMDMDEEQNAVRTAEFFKTSRAACILNCKKLLSAQHLLQSTISKAQLRWFMLAFRTFEPAATLCAAILQNPTDPQADDLDKWVEMARDLLLNMGSENVVALEGVKGLDILRTRCMAARNLPPPPGAIDGDTLNLPFYGTSIHIPRKPSSADSDSSASQSPADDSSAPSAQVITPDNLLMPDVPPPPMMDYQTVPVPDYQWAAQVLGEPQFTISDMLGPMNVSDSFWNDTLIENVFDAHFPSGYDVLGGNMDVLQGLQ